jgi:Fe-Mn family superoxide dismutase
MYSLPSLPYSYGALEPYIETHIMELHHAKHQQAYVDGLNGALVKFPELYEKPLVSLLQNLDSVPESIRTAVRNHGGGVENHTFFWDSMSHNGGGLPVGTSAQHIEKFFDSYDQFKSVFSAAAKDRFGSGWVWLSVDPANQHLVLSSTANQDTPLSQGLTPILGLDVWEHAYYLQYFNRRVDYVTAWWNVVNWEKVEERYSNLLK